MRDLQSVILSAVDTSSQTTASIDASQLAMASFQADFSENTAAGTIQIQSSNDPVPYGNVYADFTPVHWVNVPGTTATATVSAGASVIVYIPVNYCSRHLRVVFTRTGGAGTMTISMNAKGV